MCCDMHENLKALFYEISQSGKEKKHDSIYEIHIVIKFIKQNCSSCQPSPIILFCSYKLNVPHSSWFCLVTCSILEIFFLQFYLIFICTLTLYPNAVTSFFRIPIPFHYATLKRSYTYCRLSGNQDLLKSSLLYQNFKLLIITKEQPF